jgi:hypothetical protein
MMREGAVKAEVVKLRVTRVLVANLRSACPVLFDTGLIPGSGIHVVLAKEVSELRSNLALHSIPLIA